jgi:hypothetical protein
MGFGKAFGFSLLAYIGLNFLFIIIAYTIEGTLNALFSAISANPLMILSILFGPVIYFPGEVFTLLVNQFQSGIVTSLLIQFIGFIVSPFVGALVAGRMGENKGGSFGGWLLTSVLSGIAMAILAYIEPSIFIPPATTTTMILVLISGIAIGVFYGCFALLFTKTEYY